MEKIKGKIENEIIKAMSYNVFIGDQTDERHDAVGDMIEKYMPDVLGVQEADIRWMKYISNRFPVYAYAGEGRDGGEKGEYSAVFYRKDKFKLIEAATKWLSDTPDIVSKVSESSLNRVLSYAVLERLSDSKRFVHVNTHFEHTNDISREKQSEVLAKIVKGFEYPVLLTGDFNTEAGTKAYLNVLNSGVTDSAQIADHADITATFHGYSSVNTTIDFCFVTAENIAVSEYKVCAEKFGGRYPSDHHPVYIEFVM
ncbi:MAG: endonuclease/exonuclease/phosphatase family protein [Ruminococcaceae bacterium]|nr:endonuclease/exonuclease/phosphatase family protein [Oscillospiraceae bacterium]